MFHDMGKSCFIKLLDRDGTIQAYVRKDVIGDEAYAAFKKLDLGDILGTVGPIFKTKTGRNYRACARVPLAEQGASNT